MKDGQNWICEDDKLEKQKSLIEQYTYTSRQAGRCGVGYLSYYDTMYSINSHFLPHCTSTKDWLIIH